MGYAESEGEAFPVRLPGVDKILTTNSLRRYDTPELWHYFAVYCNVNRYGLPFKYWTETPAWVLRLMAAFDAAMKECAEYKGGKGRGKWRAD